MLLNERHCSDATVKFRRGEDDDACIEVTMVHKWCMLHSGTIAIRITIQFRFLAEVWLTRRRSCEDSEMGFK